MPAAQQVRAAQRVRAARVVHLARVVVRPIRVVRLAWAEKVTLAAATVQPRLARRVAVARMPRAAAALRVSAGKPALLAPPTSLVRQVRPRPLIARLRLRAALWSDGPRSPA